MPAVTDGARELANLLQDFFLDRLMRQRRVSPCTVASYRDTFKLLLPYVAGKLHKKPANLVLPDLDAPMVLAFPDHLETERHNAIRTRNLRLAAIHCFMDFAALRTAVDLPTIQRVRAVPTKRCERGPVDCLSRTEMAALLDGADQTRWSGQRDWILLHTLYNTGARVSEVIAINVGDVELGDSPRIRIHGKGRKERVVPLWSETRTGIRRWLDSGAAGSRSADAPLFPDRAGRRLSRSGVSSRLQVLAKRAVTKCPGLQQHRVSPHLIRHTTALHLLQSGVDLSVIAMWLGHESIETTHQYMEADLALKEKALGAFENPNQGPRRFRADDQLLRFLDTL